MKRPDPGALLERRASGGDWSAAHSGVIVAATDFTPVASAAARRAAQLAHSNNARLALLHVVGPAKRMVAPLLDAPALEIVIPALVTFLPGAALTMGAVELSTGDMLAGSARLVYGLERLLLLSFGIAMAVIWLTDLLK